jgi:uncharacterized protein
MRDAPGTQPGAQALDPGARLASLDILRGIALFGVLAVNLVTEFRVSIFEQFLPPAGTPGWAEQFVRHALEMKAFALFSLLFGFGLALQYERLLATGRPRYWLARRLLVLLAFGLVHLLLVWNGDILTEYALAGLVVLPLLGMPSMVLAVLCVLLLALYAAIPWLPPVVTLPDAAWISLHLADANVVLGSGSISDVARFSWRELPYLLPLHLFVLPRTLALFLLGALVYRSRIVQHVRDRRRAFAMVTAASLGAGVLAGVFVSSDGVASVPLAVAYAGIVLLALESSPTIRRAVRACGAAGRMAFTNYIMQSVIAGWLFFGYGLGLFGRLGAASVLAIAVVIYVFQLWLSQAWLRRYRFGPLEWLWRTLTYGKIPVFQIDRK